MHQPGNFEKLTKLYAEAETAIEDGRFEDAIAKLDEGLAIDDHFRQRYLTMYAQRAFAEQRIERWDEAIADYTKALALESSIHHAQHHFHRGMCLAHRGDIDAAIEDYGRAIALVPDQPGPYHLRGKLLALERERYAEAHADFDKLIAIRPHMEGYQLRGLCKLEEGLPNDALIDLAAASAIRTDAYTTYLEAHCRAALGQREETLSAMRRTVEIDPNYRESFATEEEFAPYRGVGVELN